MIFYEWEYNAKLEIEWIWMSDWMEKTKQDEVTDKKSIKHSLVLTNLLIRIRISKLATVKIHNLYENASLLELFINKY